jgi:hypothetical protein
MDQERGSLGARLGREEGWEREGEGCLRSSLQAEQWRREAKGRQADEGTGKVRERERGSIPKTVLEYLMCRFEI